MRLEAHSQHLNPKRANEWFALQAENFARFFGTPFFLCLQTSLVSLWILGNVLGWVHFDLYPFILLNLAFSLQAAYAAPLILLAQTRQADRDKLHAEADAIHREAIAQASLEQVLLTQSLVLEVKALTQEVHSLVGKS
jgi:uncharacterized membrane protein